jgi:F-type H+-transporting ATPase subunit epsilon
MNFQLEVVSIAGPVFTGEVVEVTLPGVSGEFTALAKHMAFVTPLTTGEVVLKLPDSKTNHFSIGKGVFAFQGGAGKLLIEDVSASDEISEERALEAKKEAEELLAKGIAGEEKNMALYQLRKSLVDLKIVRRRKKTIV